MPVFTCSDSANIYWYLKAANSMTMKTFAEVKAEYEKGTMADWSDPDAL